MCDVTYCTCMPRLTSSCYIPCWDPTAALPHQKHDAFICVTWLAHMCDETYCICMPRLTSRCYIPCWDPTGTPQRRCCGTPRGPHSGVAASETRRVHTCDVTRVHVWQTLPTMALLWVTHESLINVTDPLWDPTAALLHLRYDAFICVTWLTCMHDRPSLWRCCWTWVMTRVYLWYQNFLTCDVRHLWMLQTLFWAPQRRCCICDMTRSYVWRDSLYVCDITHVLRVQTLLGAPQRRYCICDMICSYVWRDSLYTCDMTHLLRVQTLRAAAQRRCCIWDTNRSHVWRGSLTLPEILDCFRKEDLEICRFYWYLRIHNFVVPTIALC